MKLTIEHLATYLPYGLKVLVEEYGIELVVGIHGNDIITTEDNAHFSAIKPILRPLSDLTKEIEINGEKFVPIEKCGYCSLEDCINEGGEIDEVTSDHLLSFMPFNYLRKLFEWHFDINELIEKGLAIDYNTITNDKS